MLGHPPVSTLFSAKADHYLSLIAGDLITQRRPLRASRKISSRIGREAGAPRHGKKQEAGKKICARDMIDAKYLKFGEL
jgi:hypothetical protein